MRTTAGAGPFTSASKVTRSLARTRRVERDVAARGLDRRRLQGRRARQEGLGISTLRGRKSKRPWRAFATSRWFASTSSRTTCMAYGRNQPHETAMATRTPPPSRPRRPRAASPAVRRSNRRRRRGRSSRRRGSARETAGTRGAAPPPRRDATPPGSLSPPAARPAEEERRRAGVAELRRASTRTPATRRARSHQQLHGPDEERHAVRGAEGPVAPARPEGEDLARGQEVVLEARPGIRETSVSAWT